MPKSQEESWRDNKKRYEKRWAGAHLLPPFPVIDQVFSFGLGWVALGRPGRIFCLTMGLATWIQGFVVDGI